MNAKEIIVFMLNGDIFLFEAEHLSREKRIEIEAISEGAWDDYQDELFEMSDFEIVNWWVSKVKGETGVDLVSVGIGCSFKMDTR